MGKRSPILGYNHNVRYRGLVFHVQSEDSGVATPHLFTHLFHSGVIVSTRKLVYDAGSAEESIKSLMQAQHKAVMKDLKRGHFDDKIDSYLGGTPGLLARGSGAGAGESETTDAMEALDARATSEEGLPATPGAVEEVSAGATTEENFDENAPAMIVEKTPVPGRALTPPPMPVRPSMTERARALMRPPAAVDTTLKTEPPAFEAAPEPEESAEIEISIDDGGSGATPAPGIEAAAIAAGRRGTRDTAESLPLGHQTRPTLTISDNKATHSNLGDEAKRAAALAAMSDGVPGAIRPPQIPPPPEARKPSTINASTLPPARPISRPSSSRPALSPPQVVSRPLATDDRSRRESEAVEVYSPPLPSAELPPDVRPGQYAQHKKGSQRIPLDGLAGAPAPTSAPRPAGPTDRPPTAQPDRSASVPNPVPIPAGLGRPPRAPTTPPPKNPAAVPPPPGTAPVVAREPSARFGSPTDARLAGSTERLGAPRAGSPTETRLGTGGTPTVGNPLAEPVRGRAPTPRAPSPTAPVVSRTASSVGGVVMTRPGVIVGAPGSKSAGTTVPRIRKAREDEGRGFGQGLISEKSLDEVILAYLSEDADDK